MRTFQTMSVLATGVTHTTVINTSVGGTIPLTSDGTKPRHVRFAASGTAYVRLRNAATNAVNTDAMVQPGAPLVLEVGGNTHYAVIDDGVSAKVNVTPLEDS